MNAALGGIASVFPGDNFSRQRPFIRQASAQTLRRQNAEFNLGHIQPGRMNRRKVKAQAAHDPVCFQLTEKLDQSVIMMRVQVIHHDIDAFRIGIQLIDQIPHRIGKVMLLAATSDQYMPLPRFRFSEHEQVTSARRSYSWSSRRTCPGWQTNGGYAPTIGSFSRQNRPSDAGGCRAAHTASRCSPSGAETPG